MKWSDVIQMVNLISDLITENAEIKVVRLKLSLFFQILLDAIKANSVPSYFLRDHMDVECVQSQKRGTVSIVVP